MIRIMSKTTQGRRGLLRVLLVILVFLATVYLISEFLAGV